MTAPHEDPAAVVREAARIGALIASQDNRATAVPLFAVQQRVRDYGFDPTYGCETVWISPSNDGMEAAPELAALLDSGHDDPEGVEWERVGYRDRWEFVTAAFTEDGCQAFIEVNGHNLTDPRIYVYSAYRNEEWKSLRAALERLRGLRVVEGRFDPCWPMG